MTKIAWAFALSSVVLSGRPAMAQEAPAPAVQEASAPAVSLTGNVAFTSDYAFRGISQTLRKPALQGGLDLAGPHGLSAGIWGSNLNFGEDLAAGQRAQLEVDLYGGLAKELLGVSWKLGGIYYDYPGAATTRKYNYLELGLSASRDFHVAALGVSSAYSPDFFAGSGAAYYLGGTLSVPLPLKVSLDLAAGRQLIEDQAAFGAPDYTHWQAGLSAVLYGIKVSGAYVATDLSVAECFGGLNVCAARAIVAISHSR
jgi:uncharacterized protein (TIGR02001 family)